MTSDIPDWLEPYVLEVKTALIEGQERPYLLTSKKMQPDLPMFVGYNKGLPFVSEEVPEKYRPIWVTHEIIEFENYVNPDGTMQPNHCVNSLERELKYIAPEDLEEYIPKRYEFFCGLVDYLRKNEGDSVNFIAEVTKSRDALEKILNQK